MSRLPPLKNPQAAPVVAVDRHLPAVPPDRLTPTALRQRFARPPPWQPEFRGDDRHSERPPMAAAVLVPLVSHDSGVTLLLTRRTDHLRDHAGQISFPGGCVDPGDASAVETALREAGEEIGLQRPAIDVIGELPTYTTVTAFVVTPVVALLRPGFELALDSFEVADAFEVPLAFLMDPANHRRHEIDFGGMRRRFLSMPWRSTTHEDSPEQFIWGATAAMIRNLYAFLSA
jgi:8-oxo-dGTP pyrophosphatase MutT (NUDIX family)